MVFMKATDLFKEQPEVWMVFQFVILVEVFIIALHHDLFIYSFSCYRVLFAKKGDTHFFHTVAMCDF